MAAIRTGNTKPELAVRRALHARGFRYRLHVKALPGTPDLVMPGRRVAVFVHGCFWHGCLKCDRGIRRPKENAEFWAKKLTQNQARDSRNVVDLQALGWRVVTFWECDTRSKEKLESAIDGLQTFVRV
ncbi:DNA mismatch endonuclease Vsr [Acidisoma cellulosilytica]|uniref:DNA mismatch endonuclease Vsr n=2 Tax=Acidisoma cellulosilyticum TaxID=2802395 RepID=A0A963Z482_9PROT|nr:DNA mismatch endonuclease Vsr [Acidisoma cellulosilyticum]